MVIRTLNSTYEVDTAQKRIRRIHGTAVTRITDDWRTYLNVSDIEIGKSLLVVWEITPQEDREVITKTTLTSPLVEIFDKTYEEILN